MPIANIPIIYFLVIIGQMMGGGGYGNMANNGGMNQGMRGANQGGGMNQPWSGQMGNPQGAQMRQQPQQVNKNLRVLPRLTLKLCYNLYIFKVCVLSNNSNTLQAWGGGGPNHQGGQGYPGSQQWGGFNR